MQAPLSTRRSSWCRKASATTEASRKVSGLAIPVPFLERGDPFFRHRRTQAFVVFRGSLHACEVW
ncbi:MAG: hypothetical protein ACLVHS_10700 [Blautia wexlerae]